MLNRSSLTAFQEFKYVFSILPLFLLYKFTYYFICYILNFYLLFKSLSIFIIKIAIYKLLLIVQIIFVSNMLNEFNIRIWILKYLIQMNYRSLLSIFLKVNYDFDYVFIKIIPILLLILILLLFNEEIIF